jgi:VWFA-related protein
VRSFPQLYDLEHLMGTQNAVQALAAGVFVLLAISRPLHAFAQQPTITVSPTEVFVDVTVTDKSGSPIRDLSATDFRILEDGKPVAVRSFRPIDASFAPTIKGMDRIALPANTYLNAGSIDAAAPINIIYIDLGPHEELPATAYFRRQLLDFLQSKPAGAQFALFVGRDQPRMLHGFTANRQELLDTLLAAKFLAQGGRDLPYDSFTAGNDASNLMRRSYGALLDMQFGHGNWSESALPPQSGAARDSAFEARRQACAGHMIGLLNLARYVAQIPGRKNIFWVTTPFELAASTINGSFDCTDDLKQDAALLTVAHATVYSFDIRPLNGFDAFDVTARDASTAQDFQTASLRRHAEDNTLNLVSDQTGGHAFYSRNDFDAAMKDALSRGAHYYALTYAGPGLTPSGKYHAITVELIKPLPGASLSYRRGYWAILPPKSEPQKPTGAIEAHLAYGLQYGAPPLTQLLFWAQVQLAASSPAVVAMSEKKPKNRAAAQTLRVSFSLVPATLNPALDNGNQVDVIYGAAAFDAQGKRIAQKFARVQAEHAPSVLAEIDHQGLQFPATIDLPAAAHSLRLAACTVARDLCGSMSIDLQHLAPPPPAPSGPGN